MEIIWTKTKTVVTLCALLLAGGVMLVKHFYFPSVGEESFRLDSDRLTSAPARVLILRPTHFADSRRSGAFWMPDRTRPGEYDPKHIRLVGRNVPLEQVIATAFQCQLSRVVPPSPPVTNRYDFLVTVKDKPAERLQTAIKRKLGYTARWQDHETEVLQLKVRISGAPGLKPGTEGGRGNNFKNGRLEFRNTQLGNLTGLLEYALKQPVQDKTGLTGSYDFSIPWNYRRGGNGPDEAELKKGLSELGLVLVRETETMSMLVVENAK